MDAKIRSSIEECFVDAKCIRVNCGVVWIYYVKEHVCGDKLSILISPNDQWMSELVWIKSLAFSCEESFEKLIVYLFNRITEVEFSEIFQFDGNYLFINCDTFFILYIVKQCNLEQFN